MNSLDGGQGKQKTSDKNFTLRKSAGKGLKVKNVIQWPWKKKGDSCRVERSFDAKTFGTAREKEKSSSPGCERMGVRQDATLPHKREVFLMRKAR